MRLVLFVFGCSLVQAIDNATNILKNGSGSIRRRIPLPRQRLGGTLDPPPIKDKNHTLTNMTHYVWSLEDTLEPHQYEYPDPWWPTIDSIRDSTPTETPATQPSMTIETKTDLPNFYTDPLTTTVDLTSPVSVTKEEIETTIMDDDEHEKYNLTAGTDNNGTLNNLRVNPNELTFRGLESKSIIDDNLKRIIANAGGSKIFSKDNIGRTRPRIRNMGNWLMLDRMKAYEQKSNNTNKTTDHKHDNFTVIDSIPKLNTNSSEELKKVDQETKIEEGQEKPNNITGDQHVQELLKVINKFVVAVPVLVKKPENPEDLYKIDLNVVKDGKNNSVNIVFNKFVENIQLNVSGNTLNNLDAFKIAGMIKKYFEKSPSPPEATPPTYSTEYTSPLYPNTYTITDIPAEEYSTGHGELQSSISTGGRSWQETQAQSLNAEIPKDLEKAMRVEMKKNKIGFFSIFLITASRIVSLKPDGHVYKLSLALEPEYNHLLHQDQVLATFGPKLREAVHKFVTVIPLLSPIYIKGQAMVLHHSLQHRREYMTREMNSVMDFIDSLYDEKEGAALLRATKLLGEYPNNTDHLVVMRVVTEAMFAPYKRLSGSIKKQILVETLEKEVDKIETAVPVDIKRVMEEGGSFKPSNNPSHRRYFSNKTRFSIVRREREPYDDREVDLETTLRNFKKAVTIERKKDRYFDDVKVKYSNVIKGDFKSTRNGYMNMQKGDRSVKPKTTQKYARRHTIRERKVTKLETPDIYTKYLQKGREKAKDKKEEYYFRMYQQNFTRKQKTKQNYKTFSKLKAEIRKSQSNKNNHDLIINNDSDYYYDENEWKSKLETKKYTTTSSTTRNNTYFTSKDKILRPKIKPSNKLNQIHFKLKDDNSINDSADSIQSETDIKYTFSPTLKSTDMSGEDRDYEKINHHNYDVKDDTDESVDRTVISAESEPQAIFSDEVNKNKKYDDVKRISTNKDKFPKQNNKEYKKISQVYAKTYSIDDKYSNEQTKATIRDIFTMNFESIAVNVNYAKKVLKNFDKSNFNLTNKPQSIKTKPKNKMPYKTNLVNIYKDEDEKEMRERKTETVDSNNTSIFGHLDEKQYVTNVVLSKNIWNERKKKPLYSLLNKNHKNDVRDDDEHIRIKPSSVIGRERYITTPTTRSMANRNIGRPRNEYINNHFHSSTGSPNKRYTKPIDLSKPAAVLVKLDKIQINNTKLRKPTKYNNEFGNMLHSKQFHVKGGKGSKKDYFKEKQLRFKKVTIESKPITIYVNVDQMADKMKKILNKNPNTNDDDQTIERKSTSYNPITLFVKISKKKKNKAKIYSKESEARLFNKDKHTNDNKNDLDTNKSTEIFGSLKITTKNLLRSKNLSSLFMENQSKINPILHKKTLNKNIHKEKYSNNQSQFDFPKYIHKSDEEDYSYSYISIEADSKPTIKSTSNLPKKFKINFNNLRSNRNLSYKFIKNNWMKSKNATVFSKHIHKTSLKPKIPANYTFKYIITNISKNANILFRSVKSEELKNETGLTAMTEEKHRNVITDLTSYSDEEKSLKFYLDDAMRHDGDLFRNIRRHNDLVNDKNDNYRRIRKFSSYSSEEVVLKSNIYKAFSFENFTDKVVQRAHDTTPAVQKLKFRRFKPVNVMSSYSDEENVLRDKMKI